MKNLKLNKKNIKFIYYDLEIDDSETEYTHAVQLFKTDISKIIHNIELSEYNNIKNYILTQI